MSDKIIYYSDTEWLTLNPESSSVGTTTLTIKAAQNTDRTSKEGSFKIINLDNESVTVNVTQNPSTWTIDSIDSIEFSYCLKDNTDSNSNIFTPFFYNSYLVLPAGELQYTEDECRLYVKISYTYNDTTEYAAGYLDEEKLLCYSDSNYENEIEDIYITITNISASIDNTNDDIQIYKNTGNFQYLESLGTTKTSETTETIDSYTCYYTNLNFTISFSLITNNDSSSSGLIYNNDNNTIYIYRQINVITSTTYTPTSVDLYDITDYSSDDDDDDLDVYIQDLDPLTTITVDPANCHSENFIFGVSCTYTYTYTSTETSEETQITTSLSEITYGFSDLTLSDNKATITYDSDSNFEAFLYYDSENEYYYFTFDYDSYKSETENILSNNIEISITPQCEYNSNTYTSTNTYTVIFEQDFNIQISWPLDIDQWTSVDYDSAIDTSKDPYFLIDYSIASNLEDYNSDLSQICDSIYPLTLTSSGNNRRWAIYIIRCHLSIYGEEYEEWKPFIYPKSSNDFNYASMRRKLDLSTIVENYCGSGDFDYWTDNITVPIEAYTTNFVLEYVPHSRQHWYISVAENTTKEISDISSSITYINRISSIYGVSIIEDGSTYMMIWVPVNLYDSLDTENSDIEVEIINQNNSDSVTILKYNNNYYYTFMIPEEYRNDDEDSEDDEDGEDEWTPSDTAISEYKYYILGIPTTYLYNSDPELFEIDGYFNGFESISYIDFDNVIIFKYSENNNVIIINNYLNNYSAEEDSEKDTVIIPTIGTVLGLYDSTKTYSLGWVYNWNSKELYNSDDASYNTINTGIEGTYDIQANPLTEFYFSDNGSDLYDNIGCYGTDITDWIYKAVIMPYVGDDNGYPILNSESSKFLTKYGDDLRTLAEILINPITLT